MTACTLLDVYGLTIAIRGAWPEVGDAVRLDYAWFARDAPAGGSADVEIELHRRPPEFAAYGDVVSSFVTPRSTVFSANGRMIVDHSGRALSVISGGGDRVQVEGEDEHVVYDAVYYFVLGRIGRHLDQIGLPRLHALGVVGGDGAVAVLLPPTGGKSTLALQAVRDDRVRLLSDESPLLDRRARLHPFPLRIAINASDPAPPESSGRRIERFWHHPKVAVEVATFGERIAPEPAPLRHIVVGRRSLARTPRLNELPRRAAVGPLLREGVLGTGLYQGLGRAHQRGPVAVVEQLRAARGRAYSAAAALTRARVWQLVLSRDAERNWSLLSSLLR